jgi:HEPN domain-containing protein
MPERAKDWLKQAEADLKHAHNSIEDGDYEWACFAAQQTAEKGLKAIYENMNMDVKGHSILGLLKGLVAYYKVPERFYSYGRILSRYYIEARYPNGFPEGAPIDYFDKDMAREAINAAGEILGWCKDTISR